MQAIQTKYLGPTNHRGSRIVAKCDAKSHAFAWDHSLGVRENHARAASLLAESLGWLSGFRLESGCLPDGSYAHVLVAENVATLGAALARHMGMAGNES